MTKLEEHIVTTETDAGDVDTLCQQMPKIEQDTRDVVYHVASLHPEEGLEAFEPAGTVPTIINPPVYGAVGWADDYADGESISATGESVVDASTTTLGTDGNVIAMEVDMGTYSGEFVVGLVDTGITAADAGGLGENGQLDIFNDGSTATDAGIPIDLGEGIPWGSTTTGFIVDTQLRKITIYADDTKSGEIDLTSSAYDAYFASPENLSMRVVSTVGTGEFSATADEASFTQTYSELAGATGNQTGEGPNAGSGSVGQGPANDPAGDIQPSKLWRSIASDGTLLSGDSAENMAGAISPYNPTGGLDSYIRTDAVAISGSRVMIAEAGKIHLSSNNGSSFTTFTLGSGHTNSEAIATDGRGVWIVTFEAGAAYRTVDNGETWYPITLPVTDNLIRDIAVHPGSRQSNGRWMMVGNNGTVIYSKDGGETWVDETINSGVGHLYSVDNSDYANWCAVGNGGLIVTNNEGYNWTHKTLSALNVTGTLYVVCSDNNGNWVAGGTLGQIIYSSDTVSWPKSPVPLPGPSGGDGDGQGSVYDTIRHIASGDGLWLMGTSQRNLFWSNTNGIFWTHEAIQAAAIYNVIGPNQTPTAVPLA